MLARTVAGVSARRRSILVGVLQLYFYWALLILVILYVPNSIWNPATHELLTALGVLALWRYGWWAVHVVRGWIFTRRVYPRMRVAADQAWALERPRTVQFMMTTFRERPDITRAVLRAISDECAAIGARGQLFIGTGSYEDEQVIGEFIASGSGQWLDAILVRQSAPGKRMAIGAALRAMARRGVDGDAPVVFMDGDAILDRDSLRKCLALMLANPNLSALTTNEKATVLGPRWIQDWLDLRFAQRHLGMCSHALSNKVLTLTGRMSVLRAKHVTQRDFIRLIESDHLDHWLWGRFRFLSGDDKSSWYWLLKHDAKMTYVPDAMVYTIEKAGESGLDYIKHTLLRWSGNMMRNGYRALQLGPRKVGIFIWWCLLDQRMAVITSLVGPLLAILTAIMVTPLFLLVYLIWIAFTRMVVALFLFPHAGYINLKFPFLLFGGQVLNAALKVYLWFRLPKQRWKNRGNQRTATGIGWAALLRDGMASYLTLLLVMAVSVAIAFYADFLRLPSLVTVQTLWR
ncbi:MAG: glycosyltransferase [Thiotrichales bacterium]